MGSRPGSRSRTERAQVVSVSDDGANVTVRCDASQACSSCSSLFCAPRTRVYRAAVGPATPARAAGEPPAELMRLGPGDWVEVEVPETGAVGKGALLFGLPIALFVGVYLALAFTQSDVMRAAGGFGGLAAGFGIAVLVSRLWKEPAPRVTRVYRDPELVSVDPPASSYP